MDESQAFSIEITKQGWLGPSPGSGYDAATVDLCSHGDVRLIIGGQVVSPGDGEDGGYGISEGALALLRSLDSDHLATASWDSGQRVAQRLIPHGCGAMLMFTCPIGIDWSVSHARGLVRISDVRRCDTVDEAAAICFPALAVELTEDAYRRQVVAFAMKAKVPFEGVEKTFSSAFGRQAHREAWDEYDRLLIHASLSAQRRQRWRGR
jgi:hypothetical protein